MIYEAWTIDPYNYQEVRNYAHESKGCVLLSKWIERGGRVGEVKKSYKPACPYCSVK